MTGGRRGLAGVGAAVAVLAVAGLGVYFAAVGLDKADKLASVVGALVAVVGLAVALYGVAPTGGGRRVRLRARADDNSRIEQIGGNTLASSDGETRRASARLRARASGGSQIRQVGGDDRPPGVS